VKYCAVATPASISPASRMTGQWRRNWVRNKGWFLAVRLGSQNRLLNWVAADFNWKTVPAQKPELDISVGAVAGTGGVICQRLDSSSNNSAVFFPPSIGLMTHF